MSHHGDHEPAFPFEAVRDDEPVVEPHPDADNPVLSPGDVTDRADAINIGDPTLAYDGRYHLFFEVQTDHEGPLDEDIGHATSDDGLAWTYDRVVIDDPGHLAYPHVFRHGGEWYMVPDAGAWSCHFGGGLVRLYRATDFPTEWELVARPLGRLGMVDPTPFPWRDRWYLLGGLAGREGGYEGIALYHADALDGEWTEHPESPVHDPAEGHEPDREARPGGRPIVHDDGVDVFFQDCVRVYGDKVRAYRITELTPETYADREHPSSPVIESQFDGGWNADGMHHVDAGLAYRGVKNVVSVDGKADAPGRPGSAGIYRLA